MEQQILEGFYVLSFIGQSVSIYLMYFVPRLLLIRHFATSRNFHIKTTSKKLKNVVYLFHYLIDPKVEIVAEQNQIVFSGEQDHITPVMTWCYTAPRIITEIYVMPVPFFIPDLLKEDLDGHISKVSFLLLFLRSSYKILVCLLMNYETSLFYEMFSIYSLCDWVWLILLVHTQSWFYTICFY